MRTSFVVPAHNESHLISAVVTAIRDAATAAALHHEIIVVDDASDDGTGPIAEAAGARVVRVEHRHIAATRNSGAAASDSPWIIFVDGDTIVTPKVIDEAAQSLRAGAAGGGCRVRWEGRIPLYGRVLLGPTQWILQRLMGGTSGCFIFCTRAAFEEAGGFDEALYASEELGFCRGVRRAGRFEIVPGHVITSGRKLRAFSAREIFGVLWLVMRRGPSALRRREGLDVWYGDRIREGESEWAVSRRTDPTH